MGQRKSAMCQSMSIFRSMGPVERGNGKVQVNGPERQKDWKQIKGRQGSERGSCGLLAADVPAVTDLI